MKKINELRSEVSHEKIEAIIQFHRFMYDVLKLIARNPTAKEIQKTTEALKRAEAILRAMDLGLRRNKNEAHRLSTTFEGLRQAQEYLLKIPIGKPGRKFNATVFGPAACALELACTYEHETKSW